MGVCGGVFAQHTVNPDEDNARTLSPDTIDGETVQLRLDKTARLGTRLIQTLFDNKRNVTGACRPLFVEDRVGVASFTVCGFLWRMLPVGKFSK